MKNQKTMTKTSNGKFNKLVINVIKIPSTTGLVSKTQYSFQK